MAEKDPFIEYVDKWDALVERRVKLAADKKALTATIDAELSTLTAEEMTMRKGLAESVKTALGDKAKEGVNHYTLVDGRKLKLTMKTDRAIDEKQITYAREEFGRVNDLSGTTFDALLRVKYELAKAEWNKLNAAEKLAVSHMVTTKDAAPVIEFN